MPRHALKAVTLILLMLSTFVASAEDLVVYTARNEQFIKPIFDRYTAETGVKIRFHTDKEAPLLARLQAEGAATPSDILMTVDAGNLWQAAELGLLSPYASATLKKNIPAYLRDPNHQWFGFSVRARTIIYNSQRIKPAELSTYAALAGSNWKGRLCLRSSKKVYNQSLVAMMIKQYGAKKTEDLVRGWVTNLATAPFASDDEVIKAVASDRCDVGIVNTYYLARMQESTPNMPVKLFWADQAPSARGVHVNVSGAGITRHAKNRKQAERFLNWLSGQEAQSMFAALNKEFPANPAIASDPAVRVWGNFRRHELNLVNAGKSQVEAVKLMDRAGYR
jgi:iron(III) transport system substrate-binding protein